ncbi:unnamed protein product [Camellia sinensis]
MSIYLRDCSNPSDINQSRAQVHAMGYMESSCHSRRCTLSGVSSAVSVSPDKQRLI